MNWSDFSTTVNASATKPVTFESVKAIIDECNRRWPQSERCTRIALAPGLWRAVVDQLETETPISPTGIPASTIYSIPFGYEVDLPKGSIREYMQDGSSVLTYRTGIKVRCLRDTDLDEFAGWSQEAIIQRMQFKFMMAMEEDFNFRQRRIRGK